MAAPIEITISAEAVAWYAAIVATAGLLLSAYLAYRDRVNLRISVNPDMLLVNGVDGQSEGCLMVYVANRGRRPVTIDGISLTPTDDSRGELLLTESAAPRTITEGKAESYPLLHSHLEKAGVKPTDFKKVTVRDQTGRTWEEKL